MEHAACILLRVLHSRSNAHGRPRKPPSPHGTSAGGYGARDLHLENFSISNGGKDLISDATVTLAYGRRYGIIGRNGTGKTTLLRAMAAHDIKGIPDNCQILHVEQEVRIIVS